MVGPDEGTSYVAGSPISCGGPGRGAQLPRVGRSARRRCARQPRRRRHGGGGRRPAAPPEPRAPRGPVSEAEALKPRPDLPPAERALVVIGAGARRQAGQPAKPAAGRGALDRRRGGRGGRLHAGRSLRRLDALHLRRADGRRTGSRCPTATGASSSAWPTISSTRTASRCEPGSKNYLELYGIFPSLSVLRARFVEDEQHPCHDQESADALDAVETVTYVAPADIKKDERHLARIREELEEARQQGARRRRSTSWRRSSRRSPPR